MRFFLVISALFPIEFSNFLLVIVWLNAKHEWVLSKMDKKGLFVILRNIQIQTTSIAIQKSAFIFKTHFHAVAKVDSSAEEIICIGK